MNHVRSVAAILPLLLVGSACGKDKPTEQKPAHERAATAPEKKPAPTPTVSPAAVRDAVKQVLQPLPKTAESAKNPGTPEKIALGRMLYFDPRLSKNHDISCNTCHDLEKYGIDVREQDDARIKTSLGHKGQVGERNSPTVYNAALHVAQFWDGRAADVEEQAKGPVLNPLEMAHVSEANVEKVLASIPAYVEAFKAAFPEGKSLSFDNMAKAIGAFESTLLAPSRYDAFLAGDLTALSNDELAGLKTFHEVGCTQCHNGPLLGGTQFQKLGSVNPWPGVKDEGRFAITKNEADKFVFKVASLRNVTETGPYLHDGSMPDLGEVVAKMAEHQSARGKLKDEEVTQIMAFFGSLKADLSPELTAAPKLPDSGPKTTKPDPS